MAVTDNRNIADWCAASEILYEEAFDLSAQCLAFGRKRIEEDFSAFKKLMSCKDMTEVAECHRAFAERATRQYIQQFTSVWNHFTDIADRKGHGDVLPLAD